MILSNIGVIIMFEDKDEMLDYIEENSRTVTRELPYCEFCGGRIDSYDGYLEYCELEIEHDCLIFCCEGHMERYLEKYLKGDK
jgi:hypothetical protein